MKSVSKYNQNLRDDSLEEKNSIYSQNIQDYFIQDICKYIYKDIYKYMLYLVVSYLKSKVRTIF